MKRKTAAVYDPYLDTLGGGEKHLLSIVKLLEKQDYAVKIFWDQDLTEVIKNRLNLEFTNLQFYPNIFRQRSWLKKILWLKQIDYFFYISDGSYFFSPAKKNFIFAMVPSYHLYPHNFINKLKTFNYRFISNSQFTYHWLKQWGIESKVIYPVIDPIFLNTPNRVKKEKIILSVGRFFPQLHSKQQTAIITAFNFLIKNNPQFSDWKLILVGGLKTEDSNYLKQLKKQTANNRQIIFAPNLSFSQLFEYYQKATLFWHFTGYQIDENQHPEMVEHLGIAPLEAMAQGAIVFCVNTGGPKEIIQTGKTGFLFGNQTELIAQTKKIINDPTKQQLIIKQAKNFVQNNFGTTAFKKSVFANIINA